MVRGLVRKKKARVRWKRDTEVMMVLEDMEGHGGDGGERCASLVSMKTDTVRNGGRLTMYSGGTEQMVSLPVLRRKRGETGRVSCRE